MMYFLQNLLIVLLISHYSLCIHGLSSYSTGQSLQLDKKQSNFETTSNHNQKKTNLKSRYSLSPTSKSKGITNERVLNKSDKSETNLASSSSFITKSNLLSICLSIAYASIIVDTITLPAGLLLIKTELGLDKSFSFSKMMFAATMATMVGKLILGPPTDYFGGELTMKASMAGMTVLLLLCSITTNMNQLAPLWIAINFIYATAWGACGKVVRERFPSSEWGVQLGFISGASRIASVLAALGFGQLLHSGSLFGIKTSSLVVGGKWREIFKMSAIFQAFVLLLYIVIDRFFISIGSLNSIGTSNKGIKESTTTTMVRSSVKSSIHKNNVKTTTIYSTYTETFVYRLVLVSSQLTLALARHCRKRLQVISGVIVYLFHNLSQVSGQAFSVVCASIQSILSRVSQNWNQVRSKTSQIKVNTRIPTTNIAKTQSQSRLMKRNIVVSTNLPYHKNSINNINRLSSLAEEDENVYQVLSRVTSYPSFWLMLLGKASLLMVGQFIAFMPAYLGTEPLLLCTPSEASKISSFFAVSLR